MNLRTLIAVVTLPLAGTFLYQAWRHALENSAQRIHNNAPPQVLQLAYSRFTNNVAALRIRAHQAQTQRHFDQRGILAQGFSSLQSPVSIFFSLPGMANRWQGLNASTALQMQGLSNELQALYTEYRSTTQNSLPQGFPR
jgi:hypothetical protein